MEDIMIHCEPGRGVGGKEGCGEGPESGGYAGSFGGRTWFLGSQVTSGRIPVLVRTYPKTCVNDCESLQRQ